MDDKTVVLNGFRLNYDKKLDLSVLSTQVTEYDVTNEEDILARVQGQNIVVTKEMPVSGEIISQFPDSVKLICEAGTGYNNIDLAAAKAKGIAVCNIPAYSTERVAHTAITFILNLSSTLHTQIAMLAKGNRDNFTKCMQVNHVEVNGKTLGVIGAGAIGREVIKVAQALGMKVIAYTRTPREDEENLKYVDLETVLKESDYLTLHCPLTPQTKHIIDKDALAKMKPTAFIINTARGALIDEPALIEALQNGTIAGAGLDVQEIEPPLADNPLYELPNVIMTPHMGWKGLETRQRLVQILADNIQGYLSGNPINVVG